MSKSKDKGTRTENTLVRLHLALGVEAERVPMSGALGGKYSDDLVLPYGRGEVKSRKNGEGFKTLERWIKGCAVLFLKRDRADPVVVLPWTTYALLLERAYPRVQTRLDNPDTP